MPNSLLVELESIKHTSFFQGFIPFHLSNVFKLSLGMHHKVLNFVGQDRTKKILHSLTSFANGISFCSVRNGGGGIGPIGFNVLCSGM